MSNDYWSGWPFTLKEQRDFAHGSEQRKNERLSQRRIFEEKLLEQLELLVPGCKHGLSDLIFGDTVLDELDTWLLNQQTPVRQIKNLRRFLRQGLQRGQTQRGWQVTLPPPVMTLSSTSNPLTPESFYRLQGFRKQIAGFHQTLHAGWIDSLFWQDAHKIQWGQFIFSAITQGALIDMAALLQLPFVMNNIHRYQDQVWIDLFTPDTPEFVQVRRGIRRWFLDPISLILLKRLPPAAYLRNRDYTREWVYECLRDFLHHLKEMDAGGEKIPRSFGRAALHVPIKLFFGNALTYWHLILPPYLVAHASGQSQSTALDAQCWLRVLRKQRQPERMVIPPGPIPTDVALERIELRGTTMAIDERNQLYADLKRALYRQKGDPEPTTPQVIMQLTLLREQITATRSVLSGLFDWIFLRVSRREIRRSSAYQQLTSIGRDLLALFDEGDVLSMEAADFQAVYEEMVECCPALATRKAKVDLLRSFHLFMVLRFGWPHLEFSMDGLAGIAQADANLLTEEEYSHLYQQIALYKYDPIGHIQLIFLILGYRCGLRISEVQNLRLEDIHYRWMMTPTEKGMESLGRTPATMLIRSNPHHRLKTNNGRRQLPLNLLLSENELGELLSFHQIQRHRVGTNKTGAYLFSQDVGNDTPTNLDLIQPGLHDALKQITGNANQRFHHLRHSLVTHLLQAFSSRTQPLSLPAHWLMPVSADNPVPRMLAYLSNQGHASRKGLYLISEWIGHASPSITICHYSHNLDCLLRDELWNHSFEHRRNGLGLERSFVGQVSPANHVAQLLGLSDENLRQLCSRYGSIPAWLWERLGITDLSRPEYSQGWSATQDVRLTAPERTVASKRTPNDFSFDEWCAFLEHWRHGVSPALLESLYYLPTGSLSPYLSAMTQLFQKKGQRNAMSLVRRQPVSPKRPDKKNLIPVVPRSLKELEISRKVHAVLQNEFATDRRDSTINGLRYFAGHYRAWNNKILMMETPSVRAPLSAFRFLLERMSRAQVDVEEIASLNSRRYREASQIKLCNKNGDSSHGAYFGLILGCLMATCARLDKNHGGTPPESSTAVSQSNSIAIAFRARTGQ